MASDEPGDGENRWSRSLRPRKPNQPPRPTPRQPARNPAPASRAPRQPGRKAPPTRPAPRRPGRIAPPARPAARRPRRNQPPLGPPPPPSPPPPQTPPPPTPPPAPPANPPQGISPPPAYPGVVDRTNPISFVLLGTLFGNHALRAIQNLIFANLNFADIQMLRLTAGDANQPDFVDRIFNHTPHPSTITPSDGACQVLVGEQACNNGAHNNHYTRYCRLHGDVGPGPRPIAGAVSFNICHKHKYNEDRSDDFEEFLIHALCGRCQTRANMEPGENECVCEAKLKDWCCRICAREQIGQWQTLAEATESGMTEREHFSYEVGNAFNRKRSCPVCRTRPYLGPLRVDGEVVPQVRWCPICRNLRRDEDTEDYPDPPAEEDQDHEEDDDDDDDDEEDEDDEEEEESLW